MNIYQRAERNGCRYEANCTQITARKWDQIMEGHTRANRKEVVKFALSAGVIDSEQAKEELKRPWYNPYNHYKTKTHLIYVHSSIEHFIRVN